MSVAAKKWVRRHVTGLQASRMQVLSELAWAADDGGQGAFLSTAQIVEATKLGRSTVKRALAELEEAQLIRRHRGGRGHCSACASARFGAHVFDVVIGELDQAPADPNQLSLVDQVQTVDLVHGGPGPWSTMDQQEDVKDVLSSLDQVGAESERQEQPSLDEAEPQRAAHERPRARVAACKPVTYRGQTVPKATVADAEQLLGVFNQATSSQLAARGRQGQATAALKQICGALQDRPDEAAEVWDRGVRSMIADPPSWVDGRLMIGHLFGPRAAEHTLARGRGEHQTNGNGNGHRPMTASSWDAIADHLEQRESAGAAA